MRDWVEKLPLWPRKAFGKYLIGLDRAAHEGLYPLGRPSYSSCWEDVLVYHLLLPKGPITYLDIGAYHPKRINNTYYFYRMGGRGVNVEPNPKMWRLLQKVRPRDVNLNVAVVPDTRQKVAILYVPSGDPGGATLDEGIYSTNKKVYQVKVGAKTPGDILDTFRKNIGGIPDFVSIDVEAQECSILGSWPFSNFRPKVFCIEVTQDGNYRGEYSEQVDILMRGVNYWKVAIADLNSIYIDLEYLEEVNR